MVKMLDLDRHAECPLWAALASSDVPWTGMDYACLNVLSIYCKVFDRKEIYDLIVRKTCQSCKCPREAHAIYQQQTTNVHERLGFKLVSPADSGVEARDLGYTWVPPGVRASSRINRYFELLPEEAVPRLGSEGACSRERQIAYQLPKQDLSLEHCKHLEVQHEASFEDFVTARNEIALDIAYIKDAPYDEHCAHCDNEIAAGELVVAAPKFVESVMWHPKCFSCSTCNSLLVDLTYCVHDDKIYCERHYAEMLKPRCAGCDEVSPAFHFSFSFL
ncbi:prickle planar cell polarity protein 3 [Drosophila madeirensis]|uniref:Prickle planar cell polarity protein 3 n=1 Tax=Drosophila madeirensis TaxID=30013 RepID=A0AAU9FUZ9_DROMD